MPNFQVFLFSISLFIFSSIALAAEPPYVLRNANGTCASSTEICGDGIDEDCDGVDLTCAGSDKDRDGYDASIDCDDNARTIYSGIQVACQVNGASGTKLCQANGSYTACTATPLCEAVGSGKCYYISATTGKDNNPGTFVAPFKSFKNVVSYYRDSDKPSTAVQLKAGDVVYFFSGLYSDVYQYDTGTVSFYFANLNGTASAPIRVKNYPGAKVTLSPVTPTVAFKMFNSSYIQVEGLELTKAYGAGIRLEESRNINLRNLWVHHNDGVDNFNMAGVYLVRSSGVTLEHSLVHDNYDRTCADTNGVKTPNSRNMVLFDGGNNKVLTSVFFQTPPRSATQTGQCVVYKHGQTDVGGIFEVAGNVFKNCWGTAIGNGGYGGRIHHNLLVDSDPITILDHGGLTPLTDNIIENNTIINGQAFDFRPTQALDAGVTFGALVYRKNIVIHDGPYNGDEGGIIRIDPYGKDTAYPLTVSTLVVQDNCYYSPTVTTMFGLFSYNGFAGTSLGGLFNFSDWKALGYDLNSTVGNPLLDSKAFPGNGACQNKGIYAP